MLLDNAKALVIYHNPETREVVFNERFRAFAAYWGFRPRACAPYRARTKGKDERAVGYVKHNALAGREFASWEALEAHLAWWMREVADVRVHSPVGEQPCERFVRTEAAALRPLNGRPPFQQMRELSRRVHSDACVEVATNRYSVPWRLIGREVTVQVAEQELRVFYGAEEVACHQRCLGRRQRQVQRQHLAGIVGGAESAPSTPAPRGRAQARVPTAATTVRIRGCGRGWLVNVDHDQLTVMLARLKLTALRDQLDSLLDEAARRQLNLREALAFLCEAEVARKDQQRIQMAMSIAHFPLVRTLEGFDFEAQPSLDPGQLRELATGRWIANGDVLLLLGPPGVGKTHLAVALGREAIRQGYSVLFVSATTLMTGLAKGSPR